MIVQLAFYCFLLERCVVLREPELCPLCGATEGFDVNPSTNTRVIVTLKGIVNNYNCHNCQSVPTSFLYACLGCYELNDAVLACHSCGSNLQDSECPLDAIDRGFWPGSPQRRTKYLYDLRLFEYYNLLQLNCPGLSESGFLKSLMMYSRKRGRVSYVAHHTNMSVIAVCILPISFSI